MYCVLRELERNLKNPPVHAKDGLHLVIMKILSHSGGIRDWVLTSSGTVMLCQMVIIPLLPFRTWPCAKLTEDCIAMFLPDMTLELRIACKVLGATFFGASDPWPWWLMGHDCR